MTQFHAFLDRNLIDDWRWKITRLWTMKLALFWAAFAGLVGIYPWFGGIVPSTPVALTCYACGNIILCMVLVVARMTRQPGVDVE
jgi:hypothetical protein